MKNRKYYPQKKKRGPEAYFQEQIRDLVYNKLGCFYFHDHDSRRNYPGFPDTVIVRGDTLVFSELKSETGVVTPDQRAWLDALSRVKYLDVAMWRDFQMQDVADYLMSIGSGDAGRLPVVGQWGVG